MLKLYVMNVSPLYRDELYNRSIQLVSDRRREKIQLYLRRQDAALSLGAELLLRYGLICDFGLKKLPEIYESKRGKPFFAEPLYFSLSHSGEYAACLISDEGNVGVDIQIVRQFDMKTARRALSETAYAQLEATEECERGKRFTELWVLHESAVKLVGGSVLDKTDSGKSSLVKAPDGYEIAIAIENLTTKIDAAIGI